MEFTLVDKIDCDAPADRLMKPEATFDLRYQIIRNLKSILKITK